jgi:hypothetical protein
MWHESLQCKVQSGAKTGLVPQLNLVESGGLVFQLCCAKCRLCKYSDRPIVLQSQTPYFKQSVDQHPTAVTRSLTHKKSHLPHKTCPICQRPFAWRKKWEKVWEDVKYCSERCKTLKKGNT